MAKRSGQIGLDAGLKALYTASDSNVIINPRTLAKHEKRIKRLQRELSRKQKGSRNREKARLRLAKSVSDASWSSFYRKLGYKMADHGGVLVRVPKTYPSSQRCSCCGEIHPEVKDLSIRRWKCASCGTEHDRDVNAAKNILEKGLEMMSSQAS